MNILHITYDMRIGGAEMVIKNIIDGMHGDEFNMSIFCIEDQIGPWGKQLQENGIAIQSYARKSGFDWRLVGKIREYIRACDIDIVHCHQYSPWVYGTLAAIFTKAKVIFTEHGRFYPDSGTTKRKLANFFLMKATSSCTAISKATKQALVTYENIPHRRIEVIYNGIAPLKATDQNRNTATNQTFKFGTVARLDPIKNQSMMIKAFARVINEGADAELIIVGDGDMRNTLESLVQQLNITDSVIFTGYKTDPTAFMVNMDVFLLSSLSEGTSMTLLEAMSLGKPCIVTNAGGNPEIIEHGINGIVVDNDDENAFYKAMLDIISDKDLLEKYGAASAALFKSKYCINKLIDNYKRVYNSGPL